MGMRMSVRFLAEFELYVMLAVAQLDDDAYGASIRRAIEDRTGRSVSIGALYATLGRLGEKGLLDFEVSDPLPIQGGRARKFCRLTPEGREALHHSTAMLRRMMEGAGLAPDPSGGS
jgi:DNA-binding PadR family transcriptional regulator